MSKINKTKYALLGILSLTSASGYDLKKLCDFSIAHFWNENYAHIYPVLKEMEKEGFAVKVTEQNEGRPPRNVYSITDKGKAELNEWLLLPVESTPPRNELLLKLFFSTGLPFENIEQKIMDYRKRNEAEIEEYRKTEDLLTSEESTKNEKGLPFWLASLSFGKHHSEAMLKWCDETLAALKKMEENEE